jgi:hypothetical protein
MASLRIKVTSANANWADRHNTAVSMAKYGQGTHQSTVVRMLQSWSDYAAAHKDSFGSPIGNDYVLGPNWKDMGLGIRGLLNGLTGNLDCGTLDAFILDTMQENGVGVDNL